MLNIRVVLVLCGLATAMVPALAGDAGGELRGRVVLEWIDDAAARPRARLMEDLHFTDAEQKVWTARGGFDVAGSALPRIFNRYRANLLQSPFRHAALLHDYYSDQRSEPWRRTHRMFYAAARAGGAGEVAAKQAYLAVFAEAMRWEVKGSSCFRGCHNGAEDLTWRPEVDESDLAPIQEWIDAVNPNLDSIERRVADAIKRPGPHLFVQRRR